MIYREKLLANLELEGNEIKLLRDICRSYIEQYRTVPNCEAVDLARNLLNASEGEV